MTLVDALFYFIHIAAFPITIAGMLGIFVAFLRKSLLKSIIRFIDQD